METKKIYFANGLFSYADRMFNEYCWAKIIDSGLPVSVYLPQKNMAINDKAASATSLPIYEGDTNQLKDADILIAVLDGVCVDPGVASEIGWVAGWNEAHEEDQQKLIIGIYTDTRDFSKTNNDNKDGESVKAGLAESQYHYANLYTIGCCKKYGNVFDSIEGVLAFIKQKFDSCQKD